MSELISKNAQEKLRQLAFENRMFLKIHTLDWFASAAASVLNLAERGAGTWPLPMRAYSHKKLSTGLPKAAYRYFDSRFGLTSEYLLKKRLNERRITYSDYERELNCGS